MKGGEDVKNISDMSPEECLEELAFNRFRNLLNSARKKQVASSAATYLVYKALEDLCIDAETIETDAENADNLLEAISCYIQYGEYSVAGIMKELRAAWRAQE